MIRVQTRLREGISPLLKEFLTGYYKEMSRPVKADSNQSWTGRFKILCIRLDQSKIFT